MTRRKRYSPEAYVRYRRHFYQALRFGGLWFGALGLVLALSLFNLQGAAVFAWVAAIAMALLAFSLLVAAARLLDLARPNLMPYFSAEVPGCGLCVGHRLLKHSHALDGVAESTGLRRIGSFVSDDDLFDGSGPTWHSAAEALTTFAGLLERCGSHPSVEAARRDLEHIRDRLRLAVASDSRFCLLVRDVHATNAREWGMRQGHY